MGPHHTVLHGLKYILQFNNSITENEHFNRFFFSGEISRSLAKINALM